MYFKYLIGQLGHGALYRSLSTGGCAQSQRWSWAGPPLGGLGVLPHEKICVFCPQNHLENQHVNKTTELARTNRLNFIYTGCHKDASISLFV